MHDLPCELIQAGHNRRWRHQGWIILLTYVAGALVVIYNLSMGTL